MFRLLPHAGAIATGHFALMKLQMSRGPYVGRHKLRKCVYIGWRPVLRAACGCVYPSPDRA